MTSSEHVRVTLPLICYGVLIGGASLALFSHDPHWLNRAGAVVSALAAASVLIQVIMELHIDHEKERIAESERLSEQEKPFILLPLDEKARRMERKRWNHHRKALDEQRILVAKFVTVSAIVGELIHGFGDLLMCFSFLVCSKH